MFDLQTKRHSLSHVMSQAVQALFPDNKILRGVGPAVDDGFYQDYDFGEFQLTDAHLKDIEKKMKQLIKQNQLFTMTTRPIDESIEAFKKAGDTYKLEMAQDLKKSGETVLSFCINTMQDGRVTMEDMCKGPHVDKMSQLDENSFKIESIAGAYWKGDSKNKMLTRIYGLAFENREGLDAHLKLIEEAKKRDHRIIAQKLKLFTISDLVGAGLPLMQPAGMRIRKEIEDYLWELHKSKGYQRVWTPHLAKTQLYKISGHYDLYKENFQVTGKDEEFMMKPMNCPHHMQLYSDNQFSYRDMPIRYFEPATIYRDEKSGQLSGLLRVRAITQDDGHLFCRVDQIKHEVGVIANIIKTFYATMGMNDYWVSLSVRGDEKDKYLGSDDVWKKAESALEEAAKENNLPYKRIEGEAAFYGPKLDFMFKDAIGREWQLSTIQCDFNMPERFDLSFINDKGEKERPVVIHRAIGGSLERCMGVLIEHFAGVFPLWLAPRQIVIVPVAEKFNGYAQKVYDKLHDLNLRVTIDDSDDSLNKKVRNAEKMHINYILVVGEKEEAEEMVAVRNYKTKEQKVEYLEKFIKDTQVEIAERKL